MKHRRGGEVDRDGGRKPAVGGAKQKGLASAEPMATGRTRVRTDDGCGGHGGCTRQVLTSQDGDEDHRHAAVRAEEGGCARPDRRWCGRGRCRREGRCWRGLHEQCACGGEFVLAIGMGHERAGADEMKTAG